MPPSSDVYLRSGMQQGEHCEGDFCDGKGSPVYYCVNCDSSLCDLCWDKERAHRPDKRGPDGFRHEKTNRAVVKRYRDILEPSSDPLIQKSLHKNDENTNWFGVEKDESGTPEFRDHDRYATLMAESIPASQAARFPQLVSFIGTTGAGKSTLVRMLIENQEITFNPAPTIPFPAPIVGSVDDSVPTSGDVHLYADPGTYHTLSPILYADCEGLHGGESDPVSARSRASDNLQGSDHETQVLKLGSLTTKTTKTQKSKRGIKRTLKWATNKENKKREYAVTELYPRLLYTFSDVVVFVLRESKTFESMVLPQLIAWAATSLEKSLNQPALPHAVLVLNATDLGVHESQWDPKTATDKLLYEVRDAIKKIPNLQDRCDEWISNGREIRNTRDLLMCYYSSITVIRIPSKSSGRYMFIHEQVTKLHQEIVLRCHESHKKKAHVRMLSNADNLQVYLQAAFDHFSQDLEVPFNFVEVALKNNPIPRNFSGNILKLAIEIAKSPEKPGVPTIFEALSPLVASCIMLDIHRQKRMGTPKQLLEDHYMDYCIDSFEEFCQTHWRCSFQNKKGRCANVKRMHNSKDHQDAFGKRLSDGNYQASFDDKKLFNTWTQNLEIHVDHLQDRKEDSMFKLPNDDQDVIVSDLHRQILSEFYHTVGHVSHFISTSTCFCCLRELPEHPLSCGHVLCTPCVKVYGRSHTNGTIEVYECPLHPTTEHWDTPTLIRLKPALAGVRILCLDGGGMRGIVELEVLRAIEKELPSIPIQSFLDLIVGTSTGGIVALGIGVERWTIVDSIERFKSLCLKAFTPRHLQGVLLLKKLEALHHKKSAYKTKPLEETLKQSFTEELLFGGSSAKADYPIKVAVIATKDTCQNAVILTNYNRGQQKSDGTDYEFERADKPEQELLVWEAARATSAAPGYFKEYRSERNRRGYYDGALYYNNPVRIANLERRLIWPDLEGYPPDLLLSIGSGCTNDISKAAGESTALPDGGMKPVAVSKETVARSKSEIKNTFKLLKARLHSILDTELIWKVFASEVTEGNLGSKERYQRINPTVGTEVPDLDDTSKLKDIQFTVHLKCGREAALKNKIINVAHRLVASSFYFEKSSAQQDPRQANFSCSGKIVCRLSETEIRELGEYFIRKTTINFEPYFIVGEQSSTIEPTIVKITKEIVEAMRFNAVFDVGSHDIRLSSNTAITTISLCMANSERVPISGFPRPLLAQETSRGLRFLLEIEAKLQLINNLAQKPIATKQRTALSRWRFRRRNINTQNATSPPASESDLPIKNAHITMQQYREERFNRRMLAQEGWLPSFANGYPYCDICLDEMHSSYYHCFVCKHGDFDVCTACQSEGEWCADKEHALMKTASRTLPFISNEDRYKDLDGDFISFNKEAAHQ